jgi:hypothetical protein
MKRRLWRGRGEGRVRVRVMVEGGDQLDCGRARQQLAQLAPQGQKRDGRTSGRG